MIDSRIEQEPRIAQEVASGLKALRFESKLCVTSADCMQQVAVPPFLSLRAREGAAGAAC